MFVLILILIIYFIFFQHNCRNFMNLFVVGIFLYIFSNEKIIILKIECR